MQITTTTATKTSRYAGPIPSLADISLSRFHNSYHPHQSFLSFKTSRKNISRVHILFSDICNRKSHCTRKSLAASAPHFSGGNDTLGCSVLTFMMSGVTNRDNQIPPATLLHDIGHATHGLFFCCMLFFVTCSLLFISDAYTCLYICFTVSINSFTLSVLF